jgi:hypothetical protein
MASYPCHRAHLYASSCSSTTTPCSLTCSLQAPAIGESKIVLSFLRIQACMSESKWCTARVLHPLPQTTHARSTLAASHTLRIGLGGGDRGAGPLAPRDRPVAQDTRFLPCLRPALMTATRSPAARTGRRIAEQRDVKSTESAPRRKLDMNTRPVEEGGTGSGLCLSGKEEEEERV